MPRWQDTYDALTGERYPGLVAYASLFTDTAEEADAVVAAALTRTLARGRSFPAADAVETDVRHAIARMVVRAAGPEDGPARPSAQPSSLSTRDPDPSAFAPPGDGSDGRRAGGGDEPRPVADLLASALADLDARTRAAMILHHLDGLPVRRVADVTGMRIEDVVHRLDRGRHGLGRRTGISVPPAPAHDALANVNMTVTTASGRGRRRG